MRSLLARPAHSGTAIVFALLAFAALPTSAIASSHTVPDGLTLSAAYSTAIPSAKGGAEDPKAHVGPAGGRKVATAVGADAGGGPLPLRPEEPQPEPTERETPVPSSPRSSTEALLRGQTFALGPPKPQFVTSRSDGSAGTALTPLILLAGVALLIATLGAQRLGREYLVAAK